MRRNVLLSIPQIAIILIIVILATTITVLAATGTTDAANAPALTSSYTLEDIFQRLTSGTAGSQSTFTNPVVAPGTGSMHDLNDIMAAAPQAVTTNGATADQVLQGQHFWGLTNGQWGQQTGSLTSQPDVTGAQGLLTFDIPNGYYTSRTATASDSDLLAENIAEGVTIFGVTGTNCDRYIDHGDDTMTDVISGHMWLKNANLANQKMNHTDAVNYCSALNFAGYNDWILPNQDDLDGLTEGLLSIRYNTPHGFINVLSSNVYDAFYWTSTTTIGGFTTVNFFNGDVYGNSSPAYVWCMRN